MNAIYSIKSSPVSNKVILDPVWTQSGETGLAQGYTSLFSIRIKEGLVLFLHATGLLKKPIPLGYYTALLGFKRKNPRQTFLKVLGIILAHLFWEISSI
jgi:hypothetical protein